MKVASGEVVSLKTDNVYNLDNAADKLPAVTPPAPLAKYLKVQRWGFWGQQLVTGLPNHGGSSFVSLQV